MTDFVSEYTSPHEDSKFTVRSITSIVLVSLLSAIPAQASDFGTNAWLTEFSSTLTNVATTDGAFSGQEITATYTHQSATIVRSGNNDPNNGELNAHSISVYSCPSPFTGSVQLNFNSTLAAGCTYMSTFPGGSTSINLANGSVTAVVRVPTANYSVPAGSELVVMMRFLDTNRDYLSVRADGTSVLSSSSTDETPTPAPSYTGPEISSFNLGSVAPGGSLVATGKKLDQVESAIIGGKTATLSLSDNGLAIGVPAVLAPGTYDLVMQTSYGKLTQINAIVVKVKPSLSSFTLKGTGPAISSDLAAEIKMIGSLTSSDYSKIHCVVNSSDAAAAAIAAEACSLLRAGSISAATTLTTLKSTFKGAGFWLRVYLAG